MCGALVLLQLGAGVVPLLRPACAFAQTPGAAKAPIQQGQEFYDNARFEDAITLLRDLVERGALVGTDLLRARELLARSYVRQYSVTRRVEDLERGKLMFVSMLRQDPSWRPDAVRVPRDELGVFEQALKEFEGSKTAVPAPPPLQTPPPPISKERGGSKKVWWIAGGGVLLAGVIAALAAGGGDGDGGTAAQPLPAFPAPPTR
jgi:hypothetical protein